MSSASVVSTLLEEKLLSEEINEVISFRPNWLIRKGNFVFLLVIVLLLTLSWVVKYPDIVQASVRLVAINAPKLLTAKTEGKLEKLLVSNDQKVQQGQILAYLQSTAKHDQVLALLKWISEAELLSTNNDFEKLFENPLPLLNELGELQLTYKEFQNSFNETSQTLSKGYYQQKKMNLQQDLKYLSAIKNNIIKRQHLLQKDFALQLTEYKAKESLANDKVIAPLELNQDKSKIIDKEQGLAEISSLIIANDMEEHDKKKEILDLRKFITDQQQNFHSALLNLKSFVEEWVQRYIVTAPVSGRIIFASFLQENQLLYLNQELFYVQPPRSQYYAELLAGQNGLGKIKVHQKVMIRVKSFPSNEFGYLTGKVDYISNIPNSKDSFLIKVDLPEGLQTNYGKIIFFRNGLSGNAEIITNNRRLFDRLIGQFKQITQR